MSKSQPLEDGVYSCHICGLPLTSEKRLQNHVRDMHPGVKPRLAHPAEVAESGVPRLKDSVGRRLTINPETGIPYYVPKPVADSSPVKVSAHFPQCPHCEQHDFKTYAIMGKHLLMIHGIRGSSSAAKSGNKHRIEKLALKQTFVKQVPAAALTFPPKETTDGIPSAPPRASKAPRVANPKGEDYHLTPEQEVAVIITVTQWQSLCLQQAARFNIPPRDLAERCAEYLRLQAIW